MSEFFPHLNLFFVNRTVPRVLTYFLFERMLRSMCFLSTTLNSKELHVEKSSSRFAAELYR